LAPGRTLEIKDSDSIETLSVKTFGGGGGGCCILPPISVPDIIKSGQKNKIFTQTGVYTKPSLKSEKEVVAKSFTDGKGFAFKNKIFINKHNDDTKTEKE
jgi:hypothetical protein